MIYRFTLSHTSGSQVLTRDPGGWKDIVSVIKRDTDYHGLFYEFESRKLDFYCDNGKEFIETIYESEGVDAEIGLLIEFSCDGTTYTTYFQGRLNMKTLRKAGLSEREYLSIGVDDAGEVKKALNRFDTVIDLSATESLDGIAILPPTAANITLHSKAIRKETLFESFEDGALTSHEQGTEWDMYVFPPLYPERSELESANTLSDTFFDCPDSSVGCSVYPLWEALETLKDFTISYNLNYNILVRPPLGGSGDYVITVKVLYKLGTDATSPTELLSSADAFTFYTYPDGYSVDIALSDTIKVPSVAAGEKLYIWFLVDNNWGGESFQVVLTPTGTNNVTISGATSFVATTAKSYYIHEALNQISEAITSEVDPFKSNYFGRTGLGYASDGCGAYTAITNGFQIRGFPITQRPVRISMKDMFESLNAIHNLGIGYENNKIVMEPKEYFYENTLLLTLNNVPDIEMSIPQRLYYSTFEFNYEKWQSEELNGLDEFNTRRQYSTGIKAIQTALRVNSKLIGSGYALEFTRRKQYSDSFTEDYKFDNDNFIICLNSAMNAAEKNENFPYTDNLISPETAYNLRISPARNALRWSNVLKPAMLKAASNLKFTYGEGNYDLVTVQNDGCNDFTAGNVTVFSAELTNDAEFDSGGTWYDGNNNPISYTDGTAELDGATTATKYLKTAALTTAGEVYTVEITVTAVSGTGYSGQKLDVYAAVDGGGPQFINYISATGTYTFNFTANVSNQRIIIQANSSDVVATLTLFSVKRSDPYTGVLTEDEAIPFTQLKAPIWIPEEYKFKYPITFAQYEIIRNNPKGYIEFSNTETGHTKGFISEVKYQRDTGLTEFTLLRKYE